MKYFQNNATPALLYVASMHQKVILGVASMHGKFLLWVASVSMHRKNLLQGALMQSPDISP